MIALSCFALANNVPESNVAAHCVMKSGREYHFFDMSQLTDADFQNMKKVPVEQRREIAMKRAKNTWTKEEFTSTAPISFIEEITAIALMALGVPGGAFSMPVGLCLLYFFLGWGGFMTGITVLATLAILPAPYSQDRIESWQSIAMIRYFSFKGCFYEMIDNKRPYILVAPPHGLFPFGNILTMVSFPFMAGFHFKGLAATLAVRMPIFKQILGSIGTISASRDSAVAAIEAGYTIGRFLPPLFFWGGGREGGGGVQLHCATSYSMHLCNNNANVFNVNCNYNSTGISTGGVAEVFEKQEGVSEAIILRSRKVVCTCCGVFLSPCSLLTVVPYSCGSSMCEWATRCFLSVYLSSGRPQISHSHRSAIGSVLPFWQYHAVSFPCYYHAFRFSP